METVSQEQLEAIARMNPNAHQDKDHTTKFCGSGFDVTAWIEEHEIPVKREGEWDQGGRKWVLEECPWNGHTDSSAYIVQLSNGAVAAGCQHNSCQEYSWQDMREHYEPGCYDRSETNAHDAVASPGNLAVDLPAAPPFPLEALPPVLRSLVEEASASIDCPPEFIAVPALSTLGAAIGNSRVVELKKGWTEGAALYVAVVAEPGDKKTPAFKVATRPAWKRQAEYKREYDQARSEHRGAEEMEGEPSEEPTLQRTVVDDTTIEALATILAENTRGLLCARDEISAWVRSLDQYKGGKGNDRQFYLSLWSNSPVIVDRRNRKEPLIISNPFVGLTGSIQPGVLSELKNNREDGLLDRFLFAYPDQRPSRWSDAEISDEATTRYEELYNRLTNLTMPMNGSGEPAPIHLEPLGAARGLCIEAINTTRAEMQNPEFPDSLKGPWSKLEAYLARISLIIALTRAASEEEGSFMASAAGVTSQDVRAATEIVNYFKAHARRVYAKLYGEKPEQLLGEAIVRFAREEGGVWDGQVSRLFEILNTRSIPGLPGGSVPFGKQLRKIASNRSDLRLEEYNRGSTQLVKLTLVIPGTPVRTASRG